MTQHATPYVVTLGLVWGLNLIVSRFGIEQITVLEYTALRFVIAVIIFAVLIRFLPGRHWSRNPALWRDAGLVGIVGTAVPMLGIIGSLQFQSAGVAALLVTTGPAFIVIVAHFLLPDAKLTPIALAGVLIALSGAVLIIATGETGLPDISQANPIGYMMVIGVLMVDAFVAVYVRRRMQDYDSFDVTGIRLLVAMLFVSPFALALGTTDFAQVTVAGWAALFFSAVVSTVVAQFLFFHITRIFGTTSLAITIYLVPIVALVSGAIFLGESITTGMIFSSFLILVGIYMINMADRRKQKIKV